LARFLVIRLSSALKLAVVELLCKQNKSFLDSGLWVIKFEEYFLCLLIVHENAVTLSNEEPIMIKAKKCLKQLRRLLLMLLLNESLALAHVENSREEHQ